MVGGVRPFAFFRGWGVGSRARGENSEHRKTHAKRGVRWRTGLMYQFFFLLFFFRALFFSSNDVFSPRRATLLFTRGTSIPGQFIPETR